MNRPKFDSALQNWTRILQRKGYSQNLVWRFREHICLRRGSSHRISIPISFLKIPESVAADIYHALITREQSAVFHLLAATDSLSFCTLAFDPWEADESDYCKEHDVYYAATEPYEDFTLVASKWHWMSHRLSQSRRLSGLDFICSLNDYARFP